MSIAVFKSKSIIFISPDHTRMVGLYEYTHMVPRRRKFPVISLVSYTSLQNPYPRVLLGRTLIYPGVAKVIRGKTIFMSTLVGRNRFILENC